MAVLRAGGSPAPTGGRCLPPEYYPLAARLVALMDALAAAGDPSVQERGRVKLWRLCAELQQIIDQALGSARCPRCTGIAPNRATMQNRVCVLHDLWTLQYRREALVSQRANERPQATAPPPTQSHAWHLWDLLASPPTP